MVSRTAKRYIRRGHKHNTLWEHTSMRTQVEETKLKILIPGYILTLGYSIEK
jgi:hypothetical protein